VFESVEKCVFELLTCDFGKLVLRPLTDRDLCIWPAHELVNELLPSM